MILSLILAHLQKSQTKLEFMTAVFVASSKCNIGQLNEIDNYPPFDFYNYGRIDKKANDKKEQLSLPSFLIS